MRLGAWLVLTAAAAASLICGHSLVACPELAGCVSSASMGSAAAVLPAVLVLVGLFLAWFGRTAVLLAASAAAVRKLSGRPLPWGLQSAARRVGVNRLSCVAAPGITAFCAGIIRPRIYVSTGTIAGLRPHELEAVLLHEQHHLRVREPLRRAMRTAAADVLFFLPVARWWAEQRLEASELAADRAAIQRLGTVAVAGALWMSASAEPALAQAAFEGATSARVAQVLGEPVGLTGVTKGAVVWSLVGVAMVLTTVACLVPGVPFMT